MTPATEPTKRGRGRPRNPPPSPLPPDAKPIGLDEGAEILGALVRRELAELTNPTKHLSGTQRQTQIQRCVTTLQSISRLTGEADQMTEKKLIRTPAFRRAQAVILEALKPYAEAMKAVHDALQGLDDAQAGGLQ